MSKMLAESAFLLVTVGAITMLVVGLYALFWSITNFNLIGIAISLFVIFISVCILLGLLSDETYEDLKEWL